MIVDKETLDQYAKHLDYHLRSIGDVLEVGRNIKASLDEMRQSQERKYLSELMSVKADLASLIRQLETVGLPTVDVYEMQMKYIREKLDKADWPEAVDQGEINSDDMERATKILDFLVPEFLEGLSFLDYNCGTGHVVNMAASRGAKMAVGFDSQQDWMFSNTDHTLFSSNFEDIQSKAPYDVILLYDVLDHAEDPNQVLASVRKLISDRGRVYIRCHPWCSRHGGHLHEKINKAYLHLILNEMELMRLGGYAPKHTNKIYKPIQTYRKWFELAGFQIEQELPIEESIENFFMTDSVVVNRIEKHWDESCVPYISIQFVDYMLTPNRLNQKIF